MRLLQPRESISIRLAFNINWAHYRQSAYDVVVGPIPKTEPKWVIDKSGSYDPKLNQVHQNCSNISLKI
jgi:hypothetical protein